MTENEKIYRFLDLANFYAKGKSTCTKVQVGSYIEISADTRKNVFGCNHGIMDCKKNGCRRIRLYGENSKEHRLPSDCDALHSEIDAICKAAQKGLNLQGATIYVTRYPCEACARAIGQAGIKAVYYGRKEKVSEYTERILGSYGVDCKHVSEWEEADNND